MKKNILKAGILLISLSAILLNGCSKENETVTPQAKPSEQAVTLSAEQIAELNAKADQIAQAELMKLKSGARTTEAVDGYDLIGLNVNSKTNTGPSAATYNFTAFIQNIGSLSPSQQPTYTYLFCAAAGHFRYAVFYLYDGYIHDMVTKGSLTGSAGGCLSGSINFSQNFAGPNTSQMYVVVFDVLNGPPGGATQMVGAWSNSRELYYPRTSVYGNYWE